MLKRLPLCSALPRLLTGLFILTSITFSEASNNYWATYTGGVEATSIVGNKAGLNAPQLFTLDVNSLKNALAGAPNRETAQGVSSTIIEFPDAKGGFNSYKVFEFSNMEPALAAAFPEIRSYVGKGIEDPTANIYFSVSPLGVQTMLLRADQPTIIIEPYTTDKNIYAAYVKGDRHEMTGTFTCRMIDDAVRAETPAVAARPNADDGTYRTFRLALSVTGEYTAYFGGTRALALAGMNATMTRVNGVFEIDFGVHMNLIANDTVLIYTNASTDPYSNAAQGAGGQWNGQLQSTLTSVIGNAGYDIGHLFGASGGGGNAGCIACVCINPVGNQLAKGSGFTSPADAIPQGDNFDIDYVAHEMGHQFGGNHTFTFSNEGTIAQTEPGSGSTIMGYAGITGSTDVQPHSDAYFHAVSIQQVTNYIKGTTCQVNTLTGNAIPTADAGLDYTIPRGTPFALTGVGTDANDVGLTFCWEQMNTGSSSTTFPSVSNTTGVAFRSFTPTASTTRYFPRLATIQAGATSWTWEAVPNVARTMSFRFTVRDNHAGGPANNSDDMTVTVSTASGPFTVSAPNTAVTWAGGSTQTVTWNVASTTASPVNCANVKISLSTDGGNTFPTVLLASTANDGTESITVPNSATSQARVKVEAVGNIFFDMSNVNFTITAGGGGLSTITTSTISPLNYCAGAAVSVPFTTNGAANAGNTFTAQLSDAAGSFASPVSIGTLSSTAAGTINATIPAGTASGSGYRIRVVSSNPSVTGSANTNNITISAQVAAAGAISTAFTSFCANLPVTFTVPAIANATNYTWSVTPSGTISNGQGTNQVTIVFPPGQPDVSATVTVFGSNANCTGISSSLGVIAWNSPTANISGTTTFCSGKTTTLTAGPAGYAYLWSTGATTQSIVVSNAATFTVTVTSPQTCNSSASTTTTVQNSPAPTIGGNSSFCPGGNVVLDAGAGFTSYAWSTGATTQTINVTSGGTYTVTVANANGCTGTNSKTVTALTAPSVSITGNTSFCHGANTTLTATAGMTSYQWSTGATTQSINVSTAATFTVTVTGANGCTNSTTATTSLFAAPTPTITGNVPFCPGGSATLNAGAGFSTYQWSTGATTQSIVVSNAGTFTVTVTNANLCSGSTSATTTVNSSLSPVISGNTSFCAGGSSTLDAGAGYSLYQWSTGATTQTINVNTAGSYTVTVSNAGGCTGSDSELVQQVSNPSPVITGNNPFCAGGSATLNAGAGFTTYLWSTGATTQTIVVSTAATFTVTVTNAGGCSGSTSAATTVNPLPTVSFSGLAASYAAGAASVTLTGSPVGGTFSGPGISGNTFSPSVAGTGTHTIIYTYTNANSCTNSSSQQTTVGSCTNAPARPGSISTVGGTARVCPGDVKSYSVAAVSGAASYNWTAPTGASVTSGQGTNAVTVTYNAGFTANGTLTVVAVNACGTSQSRTLTITRNTPSTPSVITGATAGLCNQNAIPYSVTNVAGMTYNWSFSVAGPTVASGQGTNAITANYNSYTGSASVRVTASNACGTSSQRTLTVKAAPATPTSMTGTTSPCANQQAVPYSISPIANTTNYTWSVPTGARINDGSVTSTTTTLTTTATAVTVNFATTSGSVRARGNNACGSGSYFTKTVSFVCRTADGSLAVDNDNFNLKCYPLPASKVLNVSFNAEGDAATTIRMTDMIGKTQLFRTDIPSAGKNEVQLNISSLPSGIYIVEITDGSKKEVQRIVVE